MKGINDWIPQAKNILDFLLSLLPLITFGARKLKEWLDTREKQRRLSSINRCLGGSQGELMNAEGTPDSNTTNGKLTVPLANDFERERLSPNFYLSELIHSHTAYRKKIPNLPDTAEVIALRNLAENILEPLKERYPNLRVSSAFRSPQVNKRVGGRPLSQHMKGEAADLHFPGSNLDEIYNWIKDESGLPYDQLIREPRWIHISYADAHREFAFKQAAARRKHRRRQ